MSATGRPERIHLRRTKGWRKPEGAVVVARPSRWGNPFHVGDVASVSMPSDDGHADLTIVADPALVVAMFRAEWDARLMPLRSDAHPDDVADRQAAVDALAELAGKDLACWCPLDQPCHADVLLELANSPAGGGTDHPRSDRPRSGDHDTLMGPSPVSSSPAAGTPIDKTTAEPGATGRRS